MNRIGIVQEEELEVIAKQSLVNCHAIGLHSVMFDNTPGARVRCFIARPDHNMWTNNMVLDARMSIAFHAHHCDITLDPVFGDVFNVRPYRVKGGGYYLRAHEYQSCITTGQGKFVRRGDRYDMWAVPITEKLNGPVPMQAREVHSVFVPFGQSAAWYVFEGGEDPQYMPLAWSNKDLRTFDFSPLYKPMSVEFLRSLLKEIDVNIVGKVKL
jgi:hypothetical protein